jgi:hypothetical protein
MSLGKAKLLVILGAGSSIPCGMPSVATINLKMKEWCRNYRWPYKPSFNADRGEGIFNDLWKIGKQYYKNRFWRDPDISVDFEKVLREMMAVASWVTPSPQGNVLRLAVQDSRLLECFKWYSSLMETPYGCRNVILEEVGHLSGKLAAYIRACSNTLRVESLAFQTYKAMLSRLRQEFDVGVYNLNYDNVALSAWPDAFTGFADGEFDPRSVVGRTEWRFIYHLHGSVHHSLNSWNCIEWRDDLTEDFRDSVPEAPIIGEGFKPIVPTTLIIGGFKLDQFLPDPFQTFYASLVRHAHEADAILIAGYGFGDVHVNQTLRNRCLHAPCRIVIIDKTEPSLGWTEYRSDLWTLELRHALADIGFQRKEKIKNFQQLVAGNELEKDLRDQVAIWHKGFIEAAECLDIVLDWLR